ncbi:MAG: tetratricopeptide repeat protein [Pyrinomonadaceae bacterium]
MNWQIGDRIQNRWEIHKILRGGMGIVYVVYDPASRDVYAAKTFQEEVFARSADIADRFNQEALTWVNLDSHQNVTKARFVQTIAGKPYLFLEYVSGGDLSGWIGTPRLTEDLPQVLRFAIQFCDGMMHAFFKGVTAHRDIKPQNCLITEDQTLKVTDFGLAKVQVACGLRGFRAGTPEHMAPEQWDDFETTDERSDIYSFGSMLYEMLKGSPPFGRRPEVSKSELERRHRYEAPPVLTSHPNSLRMLIQKCLAKDAAVRFRKFTEVREELAPIYVELTGRAVPLPAIGRDLTVDALISKGSSLGTLGKHEEEIASYDQAIDLNPENALAWSNKGVALVDLQRLDEALICQERALAFNPRIANVWGNKGHVLFALGRTEDTLVCIDHALELNPYYARGWYNKGKVLGDLGRHRDSLACYDRATNLDPHYETAWVNKAAMLRALTRFEDSLICCEKALHLDLRDIHAWLGKAKTLSALGRRQEALAFYDRALSLDPMDARGWCNRGVTLADLGRSGEALASFDRALELDSQDEKSWYNKGSVLVNLGRSEEAPDCFARAIEINPRYGEAWYNKGGALVNLGRIAEALDCFGRAIEINPRLPEAWYSKGGALVNGFQRYREALVCFEEAQRLGYPQAAQAAAMCRQRLETHSGE